MKVQRIMTKREHNEVPDSLKERVYPKKDDPKIRMRPFVGTLGLREVYRSNAIAYEAPAERKR